MTGMDDIQLSELLHCSSKDELTCSETTAVVLDLVRQFAWDEASSGVSHTYLRID